MEVHMSNNFKHKCNKCKYTYPSCPGSARLCVDSLHISQRPKGLLEDMVLWCADFEKRKGKSGITVIRDDYDNRYMVRRKGRPIAIVSEEVAMDLVEKEGLALIRDGYYAKKGKDV